MDTEICASPEETFSSALLSLNGVYFSINALCICYSTERDIMIKDRQSAFVMQAGESVAVPVTQSSLKNDFLFRLPKVKSSISDPVHVPFVYTQCALGVHDFLSLTDTLT